MSIFPHTDALIPFLLTVGFLVFAVFQLIGVFWGQLRILLHDNSPKEELKSLGVSVIVLAKNDEDIVRKNVIHLMEQNYNLFEVIVVNNQSYDNTYFELKLLKEVYPQLKVIQLERNAHRPQDRKLAISLGVKAAKYNHVLLASLDCPPATKSWIQSMVSHFTKKKKLVIGYTKVKTKAGLLNRIHRVCSTQEGLINMSMAKLGVPFRGDGNNLGFTKELFLESNGFKENYKSISKTDDLLVQKLSKNRNYTINLSPLSFCLSGGVLSVKKWKDQQARKQMDKRKTPLFKRALLGIYSFSLLFVWIPFVILLLNGWMSWIVLGGAAILILAKGIVLGIIYKKLEQPSLGWVAIFWELSYHIIFPIFYQLENRDNWNGYGR